MPSWQFLNTVILAFLLLVPRTALDLQIWEIFSRNRKIVRVQGCFPLFLLLILRSSVHLGLSFVQGAKCELFAFFYLRPASLSWTTCWRCCLFPVYFFLYKKSGVHTWVDLCLDLQFGSIEQRVCFCDNTMLFLWPQHCSTTWNRGRWCLSQLFSLIRTVLAIVGFCVSIWSQKLSFQDRWRTVLNFGGDCIESVDYFW